MLALNDWLSHLLANSSTQPAAQTTQLGRGGGVFLAEGMREALAMTLLYEHVLGQLTVMHTAKARFSRPGAV